MNQITICCLVALCGFASCTDFGLGNILNGDGFGGHGGGRLGGNRRSGGLGDVFGSGRGHFGGQGFGGFDVFGDSGRRGNNFGGGHDFFNGGGAGGSKSFFDSGSLFSEKVAINDDFANSLDFANDYSDGTAVRAKDSHDYAAQSDFEEANEDYEVTNFSQDTNKQLHVVDQSSTDFQNKKGNRNFKDVSDKVASSDDAAFEDVNQVKDQTALRKKQAQDYDLLNHVQEEEFDKAYEQYTY
jgi:hypothetical protein